MYAAWGGHANVVYYLLQAGAGNDAHEALRCIGGTNLRRSLGERGEAVRQILCDYLAKQSPGAEENLRDWDASAGTGVCIPPPEIEENATELLRDELLKYNVGNDVRLGGIVP